MLRTDLRFCKRKSTDQAKQITELQNMLAEQQKQTLEYANRLDENDKKTEEMSSKISTLLQELNKCKIELHYYRSKSPATPICNNCGQTTLNVPPGNLLALMKHNINNSREEIINVIGKCSNFELESKVQNPESNILQDLTTTPKNNLINNILLMHTDDDDNDNDNDNKDAPNALNEPNTPSITLSRGLIDASMSSSTSSANVGNMSKLMNRDGGFDGFEKRFKMLRHKANQNMTQWRCASYEKPSVIGQKPKLVDECSAHDLVAMTSTNTVHQSQQPIALTNHQPTKQKPSNDSNSSSSSTNSDGGSSVILTVGTPRFYGKRKADDSITLPSNYTILNISNGSVNKSVSMDNSMATSTNKTNAMATNHVANSNLSDNYNKKARRVQNKLKIQTNNMNIKTRNK